MQNRLLICLCLEIHGPFNNFRPGWQDSMSPERGSSSEEAEVDEQLEEPGALDHVPPGTVSMFLTRPSLNFPQEGGIAGRQARGGGRICAERLWEIHT